MIEGITPVLLESTLRTLLLAGIVALGIWRVRNPAVKLAAWTLVLVAGLAMPLLVQSLPPLPLVVRSAPIATPPGTEILEANNMAIHQQVWQEAPQDSVFSWSDAAGWAYLEITALLLGRLAFGLFFRRRLISRSRIVNSLGAIETRESDELAVPVTYGWLHPVIVLPGTWRTWEARKLDAVITHETAHIRQSDYLRQLLSILHASVFWFSPLSWWLVKRTAELAEETIDDIVLRDISDPGYYAEVLVDFVKNRQGSNRLTWSTVAMARPSSFGNRVDRILEPGRTLSNGLSRRAAGIISGLGAPCIFLTAALTFGQVPAPPLPPAPPTPFSGGIPPEPAAAPQPPAPPRSGRIVQAAPPPPPSAVSPAPNPSPVAVPSPSPQPAPPPPPPPPPQYIWGASEDAWAVIRQNGWNMTRGSKLDREKAFSYRGKVTGDYVWVRRGDKEFLIQDPEVIEKLAAASEMRRPPIPTPNEKPQAQQKLRSEKEAQRTESASAAAIIEKARAEVAATRQQLATKDGTQAEKQLAELQAKLASMQKEMTLRGKYLTDQHAKLAQKQEALSKQQTELMDLKREKMARFESELDGAIKKGIEQGKAKQVK